jgi:peptidylprolyl isomerase
MKPILFLIILFGHLTLQAQDIQKDINLSKLSEAIGHNIAKSLKESLSSIDITKVCQGIQDEVAGKPSPLSDEEFQNQMLLLQTQVFLESAKINLDEANAFLLKNSKEKGVQEIIPQKLQYKIIKEGNGPFIKEHSNPSIIYQGTFVDGTVFGSSVDEEPVTLSLDQTIPGFSKGLVGAKEGEKRILYVHPDLAYGTSGQLPPNKALIFTIDVIKADESEDKSEK